MRRHNRSAGRASQDPISEDLVERCRQGDQAAWSQLVKATYGEVYGLCLRILKDPNEAAEATQDAYVKAWRGLGSFRGDAAFSTWMFRIATNASLSRHRSRKRRFAREGTPDDAAIERAASSVTTEDAVGALLESQAMEAAIDSLPEQHRIPLMLRDVYGLSIAEVATQLGITETAAKVRVHRARKKMRDVLFRASGEEG